MFMTLKEKFIKEHPKAPLEKNGIPKACPDWIGYVPEKPHSDCDAPFCEECWNREYKEW